MPPGATEEGLPAASVCPMGNDDSQGAGSGARAPGATLDVLRKRADFLACARARKAPTPAFLLQARRRGGDTAIEPEVIRVGFTASRKVGNAVVRNRAKRRLRALARNILVLQGRPGWDYVLVARRDATVTRPFSALEADLAAALDRIHADRARG